MLHRHLNREARRAIVILDLEQGSRVRKGGTDMSSLTPRAGLVTVLMVSWFAAACGPSLPTNVNVDILQPHPREISLADIQAAFTGNDLLPPLYEQSPGTTLYAIVIPFDFASLPEGVAYNRVAVMMNLLKDVGESSFPENDEVNIVTAIPLSVDRTADKTASSKFAAGVTGTIKALSGNLSAEQSSSQTYQKIYRSVTAHITPNQEIVWEFAPFLDEPIQPGLYYVIAVVEVPVGSTGNLFYISAGCSYSAVSMLGISEESTGCTAGETQRVYIP